MTSIIACITKSGLLFSLCIVFMLAACTGLQQLSSSKPDFSGQHKTLLERANEKATGNEEWFAYRDQKISEFRAKFKGNLSPALAVYLENDLYLYKDDKLASYIESIVKRLLAGWQGPIPEVQILIESGAYFNAYLDELHQLHIATGVLRQVQNEDQLAAVVSHELGHVLLQHNSEKSLTQRTGLTLDLAGELMVSGSASLDALMGGKKFKDKSEEPTLYLKSLGLVWSDILAPSWSRENEREADLIGMDLMMAAAYNYEELPVVIEYIHDAAIKRSKRLEKFNKYLRDYLKKHRPKIDTGFTSTVNNTIYDLVGELGNMLVDEITSLIALLNKSHDSREDRIDALKLYLEEIYDGGDLPPEISEASFKQVVRSKRSSAMLDQDITAIAILGDLLDEDGSQRKSHKINELQISRYSPVIASIAAYQINMAEKRSLQGQHDLLDLLQRVAEPPAETYVKLADIYIRQKDFSNAEKIIDRGEHAIGRDFRFLPMQILINKNSGNIDAAEYYTLQCKKYDASLEAWTSTGLMNAFVSNTYYKKCTQVMGYDPEETQGGFGYKVKSGLKKIFRRVSPLPL